MKNAIADLKDNLRAAKRLHEHDQTQQMVAVWAVEDLTSEVETAKRLALETKHPELISSHQALVAKLQRAIEWRNEHANTPSLSYVRMKACEKELQEALELEKSQSESDTAQHAKKMLAFWSIITALIILVAFCSMSFPTR